MPETNTQVEVKTGGKWVQATVTRQLGNGMFEVVLRLPGEQIHQLYLNREGETWRELPT